MVSWHTDRIPLPAIKTLIQQLATRTNYGLDASSDLPAAAITATVPAGLQLWFWEVDDEGQWVTEFAARLEKRKKERQEVSRLSPLFWLYLRHECPRAHLEASRISSSANNLFDGLFEKSSMLT